MMILSRLNRPKFLVNYRPLMKPSFRRLSSTSDFDANTLNFQIFKKAAYAILFSATLATAYLTRKYADKKSDIIKDAVRFKLQLGRMTLYQFKGFTIPEEVLPVIKDLASFKFRPDDIILSSFPKTGVTWLQEIIWLIINNFDFDTALTVNLEDRFPFLEWPLPGLPSIEKMPGPRLIKTHLPPKILFGEDQSKIQPKIISITRNPKDVCISYYHFARMNKLIDFKDSFAFFLERFIIGQIPYGPIHLHYVDVLKLYATTKDRILIISYEDLHQDFENQVKKICDFLGKPAPSDEVMAKLKQHCDFKFMSVNPMVNYSHWDKIGLRDPSESNFFRSGKVGDWEKYLSRPQSQALDDYVETFLSDLMTFKYK